MRRISFILFLCLFGNLYFSNAQNVRLKNTAHQPLEGAVVLYASIHQSEKSAIVFSNNKGEAWVIGIPFPMIRRINLMGFLERTDTLFNSIGMEELILTAAPTKLGEVTVTGNHMPGYQRDAVVPVQVLKAEDIEKRGAVTVRDLLAQELNLRVSFDPSLGSSLTMQGTGGEHIKILIDGVPVIGRQNGNIDLGQLNLSNIERIEVVKGPMSVLYGTDALGGVINLITKTPAKEQWSGSASGYYESTGQYNADASIGLGFKNTSVTLNGGRNFFDGWDPVNENNRSLLWNPREQHFANLKATQTIKKLKLTLQSSYFREEVINKADPVITPYAAYANDQYYFTTRFNNQIVGEWRMNNLSQLNMTGSYSHYQYEKNTYRKNLVDLSEQLTADMMDDDTTTFDAVFARVTHVYGDANSKWSLLSGIDVNYETGRGKRIDNATHSMSDFAAYVSFDYKPFRHLTIRPSARVIYNSQFNAPVIPSLSIMYRPAEKFTVRGSFSMGYRAPSLKEQHLNFVDNGIHNVQGNPDLIAEKSNQFMGSVEYRVAGKDIVFTAEPGFFYNDIRNKISLVQFNVNSNLYTYINLDRFNSRGVEFKSKISHKQFSVGGGVAYTGTWGTFEGDVEQPEIAWYPEVNASADYTLLKTKSTVSVLWKYYGERPVFIMQGDGAVGRFLNESFQMLDASFNQNLMNDRVKITFGARNLLNVTNVRAVMSGGAHSGSGNGESPIGMGMSYFTKLTLTFK